MINGTELGRRAAAMVAGGWKCPPEVKEFLDGGELTPIVTSLLMEEYGRDLCRPTQNAAFSAAHSAMRDAVTGGNGSHTLWVAVWSVGHKNYQVVGTTRHPAIRLAQRRFIRSMMNEHDRSSAEWALLAYIRHSIPAGRCGY